MKTSAPTEKTLLNTKIFSLLLIIGSVLVILIVLLLYWPLPYPYESIVSVIQLQIAAFSYGEYGGPPLTYVIYVPLLLGASGILIGAITLIRKKIENVAAIFIVVLSGINILGQASNIGSISVGTTILFAGGFFAISKNWRPTIIITALALILAVAVSLRII